MKATMRMLATFGAGVTLTVAGLASGADTCADHMAGTGTLTTHAVPCDTLCTEGPLTGFFSGKLEFTMHDMVPTGIPNVSRYTGVNTVTTDKGTLVGNDVGYWNLSTGEFIDYTTFSSGTGVYANAHGSLTIVGKFDQVGGGFSHYVAVVTTP